MARPTSGAGHAHGTSITCGIHRRHTPYGGPHQTHLTLDFGVDESKETPLKTLAFRTQEEDWVLLRVAWVPDAVLTCGPSNYRGAPWKALEVYLRMRDTHGTAGFRCTGCVEALPRASTKGPGTTWPD